jgi:hypothetical protein
VKVGDLVRTRSFYNGGDTWLVVEISSKVRVQSVATGRCRWIVASLLEVINASR